MQTSKLTELENCTLKRSYLLPSCCRLQANSVHCTVALPYTCVCITHFSNPSDDAVQILCCVRTPIRTRGHCAAKRCCTCHCPLCTHKHTRAPSRKLKEHSPPDRLSRLATVHPLRLSGTDPHCGSVFSQRRIASACMRSSVVDFVVRVQRSDPKVPHQFAHHL
jgi:hypothetical protein